jgi:hypothetical protein
MIKMNTFGHFCLLKTTHLMLIQSNFYGTFIRAAAASDTRTTTTTAANG